MAALVRRELQAALGAATAGPGRKRKLIGVTRMIALRDGSLTDQAIRPGTAKAHTLPSNSLCRLISPTLPQFLMKLERRPFPELPPTTHAAQLVERAGALPEAAQRKAS